jgi:hypothetical protein
MGGDTAHISKKSLIFQVSPHFKMFSLDSRLVSSRMHKDEESPQDITVKRTALCVFHSDLGGRHIQLPKGCIIDSIHISFTDDTRYPIGVSTTGGPSIYGHEDVVITDNCGQEYLVKLNGGMKCYDLVCDTTSKPLSALELQLKSSYIHHVIDAWWWAEDVGELFREIETGAEVIAELEEENAKKDERIFELEARIAELEAYKAKISLIGLTMPVW